LRQVDVAVIGGGPAGLAAGIKAKESGLDEVVVIERGEYLGGLLDQCIHNGFGLTYFRQDLTGPEYSQRFIEKAQDLKVEFLLNSMVIRMYPDRRLVISNESGLTELSAKSIVLAMGCRERTRESLNISGTRPAGILTAGAAQRYVNVYGYIPGKEVVILGSGDVGMIMARRLALEGVNVKAVVEVLPYVGGLIRNEVQCLQDFQIPLLLEHTISEIHGRDRVEAVTVARVDRSWNPIPGTERVMQCDTVLVSAGLIPENELSRIAGIKLDLLTGGPLINNIMEASISGIFACGNVLHVNDLVDNVTREGEKAGLNAANYAMGKTASEENMIPLKAGENIRYIIPQAISQGKEVTLSLRVKEPAEDVQIKAGEILTKRFRAVKPSQMVQVTITSKEWLNLTGKIEDITVSCQKRR
jgi:NADPH-dependent 2,4-dienoyl-CoA reductase/sulfur reductase-like enzyme